ncbi:MULTISPECIES: hypothetical protein [unclassified Ruegeria]|uniref:hypothetical protein n=1 Tax=unclassified Ruegeria TaxID=2625375 RepID=UPI001487F29E|nr:MULTISPECIES: hypothetical protein [unclassified Ruegeria]NOD33909.1 hypothetical protein [Ruegeria sp. HKCCD7296]NOE40933.1 hypothetical protein [Ruegeria sp. HKCCD7319]
MPAAALSPGRSGGFFQQTSFEDPKQRGQDRVERDNRSYYPDRVNNNPKRDEML